MTRLSSASPKQHIGWTYAKTVLLQRDTSHFFRKHYLCYDTPHTGTSMHDDTQYASADRSTRDDSWYAIATDGGAHDDSQYTIPTDRSMRGESRYAIRTNASMHGDSRYAPQQPRKPTTNMISPTARKMYNPVW